MGALKVHAQFTQAYGGTLGRDMMNALPAKGDGGLDIREPLSRRSVFQRRLGASFVWLHNRSYFSSNNSLLDTDDVVCAHKACANYGNS